MYSPYMEGHTRWMQDENCYARWEMLTRGDFCGWRQQLDMGGSCEVDARWEFVMRGDFSGALSTCPLHHTKVTSCGKFSPCVHLACPMLNCPLHHTKVTLHGKFSPHIHLVWPHVKLSPPPPKVTSCKHFSPCVHLAWPHVELSPPPAKVTLHKHFSSCVHLAWPHVKLSPPPAKVTSRKHFSPCVAILILRLPCVPPPCENNIFHLAWKNSQKSHAATPIPLIRYLLRATNQMLCYQKEEDIVDYFNLQSSRINNSSGGHKGLRWASNPYVIYFLQFHRG